MGNKFGKVLALMGRPIRNFNIEDRAHKVISRDKPNLAPRHEKDQVTLDKMMNEYPEAYAESLKKHEQLDINLKNVYVKSQDIVPEQKFEQNPARPLPLDRKQVDDFEYGFKEPEKIPEGKITLKSALNFITQHQENVRLHSAERISAENSIPLDITKNILKYYKVFEVYIPEQRKVKATFAGPSVRRRIFSKPQKFLPQQKTESGKT